MTTLKALPLGIQNFEELIEHNYLYIDKTAYIHRLVTHGKLYFLSRPRRFGKSVLVSTLEALYRGRRDLFEGLYIENRWDWQPEPVIRLDFLGVESHNLEVLQDGLNRRLDEQAQRYGLFLNSPDTIGRFRELILGVAEQGRVAVLIDEYDKPILDQITDLGKTEVNRKFLSTFYAVLKSLENKLSFLLLTGVSKFTRVSLFSELNNLEDISLDAEYAAMTGITEEELDRDLAPYLVGTINGISGAQLRDSIREWYNGYSWDGETRVYNPVSVLSVLKKRKFSSFWFSTGTPVFLIELLRKKMIDIPALDQMEIGELGMDGFEPRDIHPLALLFQTGYLTIQYIEWVNMSPVYHMGFPNLEVRQSFLSYLLADVAGKQPDSAGLLAARIGERLKGGDIEAFFEGFQNLFASIPYNMFLPEQEAYYHTVIYLVLSLTGVHIACEIQTNKGRIDAVLETGDRYYITEFKLGTAAEAMAQIRHRDYAAAYRNRGKSVWLLAVGIDVEKRNVSDWLCMAD